MRKLRSTWKIGRSTDLAQASLCLLVSSLVWAGLGLLGGWVNHRLGLTTTQKILLAVVPLLVGPAWKFAVTVSDRSRLMHAIDWTDVGLMLLPVLVGWFWADSALKICTIALIIATRAPVYRWRRAAWVPVVYTEVEESFLAAARSRALALHDHRRRVRGHFEEWMARRSRMQPREPSNARQRGPAVVLAGQRQSPELLSSKFMRQRLKL